MSYPTGTVFYLKDKCYSGYNIVSTVRDGILIFDMNGNEIRRYKMNAMPAKLLPGGNIMGISKYRHSDYSIQDGIELMEIDYDGNKVWGYNKFRYVEDDSPMWMARAHGDYQREGNPVGYYVPEMEAKKNGKTLILGHDTIIDKNISDKKILDEVIYEVDNEGIITWRFMFSKEFENFGYNEQQKNVIYRNPNLKNINGGIGDYLHINSFSVLGPNKWYDQGDIRFHPDNIIFCARQGNFIGIIDKKRAKIYWKVGPNPNDEIYRKLGGIIGPTHIQIIPKGLPGEGNILLFESGGSSGYGYPSLNSPMGLKNLTRNYSRVIEFNPITWNIVWELEPNSIGFSNEINGYKFYSPYGSSAQRLPNGNTLVTLGTSGTMVEVTEDYEIVWKWICPYEIRDYNYAFSNMIYHGYRYPYEYLPEKKPVEVNMPIIDKKTFRLDGAGEFGGGKIVEVQGAEIPYDIDIITMAMENEEEIAYKKKIISMETSNIRSITSKNFNLRLKDKELSMVIYGALRCTHCNAVREIISELIENEFKDVNAFYLDIDDNRNIVAKHKIHSVPTTVLFRNEEEVYRFQGEKSYDEIAMDIEKYLLKKEE